MPRIIVEAADTALAMDEVIDRLGPGAFILSTRSVPGGVVIEAASEPPAPARPASFAAELGARMLDPAVAPATGSPDWLRRLSAGLADGDLPPVLAPLAAALAGDDAPDWPRSITVLTGPVAEDLDLTALRLAVAFRKSDATCAPELVSGLRPGQLRAPALADWAQMLGLPHSAIGKASPALPAPSRVRLAVLPADCGLDPPALTSDAAEVLVVLPAGLHPRRIGRLLSPWRGTAAAVCLTGLDPDEAPQPEELAAIAQAGLRLRAVARGAGLFDAIGAVALDDLAGWARGWCAEAGLTPPAPSPLPGATRAARTLFSAQELVA